MSIKITINPKAKFKISPFLYMQFMEPLGTADTSVDAGWDFVKEEWREELIDAIKYLKPTMIRWGGCFASYYKWREAVGPQEDRIPMYNLAWDGLYANKVGTREIVGMCRRVLAEPLMVVNMESDGRKNWAYPKAGICRLGDADEAAQWIDYCNNPDNALRHLHGDKNPYNIKYWQIGNETSYDPKGFGCEETSEITLKFAREMRKADPNIKLIAWGDDGWAPRVCEVAGEEIDLIAFHYHFSAPKGSPLYGTKYREDFALTWDYMMKTCDDLNDKINSMRADVLPYGKKLAMTEGHYALEGRNRCDVLSSWAAGVAYARALNVQERHGDILDIATMADFFGNRWQVNALMIPTPFRKNKKIYLQPVGWVMALFGKHIGDESISVGEVSGLDITASRTQNRIYLHVVNIDMNTAVKTTLKIKGKKILKATAYEIAADPQLEITEMIPDAFKPHARAMLKNGEWTFPAASVTAVEIDVADMN